jgi:hypothetical protein
MYLLDHGFGWINYPQKCIGGNEPPKRRNRYISVGLNRILGIFFRDVKHKLLQSILECIGPAASMD